jgi:hypothetical protein
MTYEQMNEFVRTEINSRTFLLYAKLLNISSQSNFQRVIELLYERRINYFMLNDLRIINDENVQKFLSDYDTTANPQILFTPTSGTFNPAEYLQGSANGIQITYITRLIEKYNASQNNDYVTDRKLVQVMRPAALVGVQDFRSYQSMAELEDAFAEGVLKPVLAHYKVGDVRQIFPLASSLQANSAFADDVRAQYSSIFGKYLPDLTNENLMKAFLSVNDEVSTAEGLSVETNELYNFSRYNRATIDTHRFHLFKLASLNRAYNDTEVAELEVKIRGYRFPTVKLSESFAELQYSCELLRVAHARSGKAAYLDSYMLDLENLAIRINNFRNFIDLVQRNILNSIKLTNSNGQ